MRATSIVSLSTGLLVLPLVSDATDFCAESGPDDVIGCFNQAVRDRDLDALSRLIADDFIQAYRPNEEGSAPDPIDRTLFLESANRIFTDPIFESSETHMELGAAPKQESRGGIWRLENVNYVFDLVDSTVTDGPTRFEKSTVTLLVREVSSPERHFVIYRWDMDVDR